MEPQAPSPPPPSFPTPSFQIKGLAYVGALAMAERIPGGLSAVRARMPDRTREQIEPFYLASAWYDVHPLADLMNASAALCAVAPAVLVRRQARAAARRDVEGVYRHTLRAGDLPERARRLPRVFNRYFQPSQAALRWVDGLGFAAELAPIPASRQAFYRAMNEGFVAGALEAAGAPAVEFRWSEPRVVAAEQLSLEFIATWR